MAAQLWLEKGLSTDLQPERIKALLSEGPGTAPSQAEKQRCVRSALRPATSPTFALMLPEIEHVCGSFPLPAVGFEQGSQLP